MIKGTRDPGDPEIPNDCDRCLSRDTCGYATEGPMPQCVGEIAGNMALFRQGGPYATNWVTIYGGGCVNVKLAGLGKMG